jgi:hypothetical protein
MDITEAMREHTRILSVLSSLKAERREAAQAIFEAEKHIKAGDPIITKEGKKVFYQGFSKEFDGLVEVLDSKKDGTPSKRIGHYTTFEFV